MVDMAKMTGIMAIAALGLMVPLSAFAHQSPGTSYAVRVENEQFSDNTVETGDIVTVTGELKNLHGEPFEVRMSIVADGSAELAPFYVEPTDDPARPGEFILPAGASMPYSISVIALKPGTTHMHTAVLVIPEGEMGGEDYAYGAGQTINAIGDEISPDTAERLIEQYLENLGPQVGYYDQTVTVDGAQIGLGISSHSAVSGFAFEPEQKRVSFDLGGMGSGDATTTIEIGKVLKGPYSVMVDGRTYDNYEIVTTQSADYQSIRLYHDNADDHKVTITGTQVVPEFPMPVLFAAIAAVGAVVLAGRVRLIR